MAETPLNPFLIGGADVAGMDIDTRHMLVPDTGRPRIEHFPGARTRYSIKPQAFYGQIVVFGPLRAETPAALYALLQQHADLAAGIELLTVTLHETSFTNCDLVVFRQLERQITAYQDSSGGGVKVMVQFIFERLAS